MTITFGTFTVLVKEIRDALGDDAHQRAYIRTVQLFGYAFAATAAERQMRVAAERSAGLLQHKRLT